MHILKKLILIGAYVLVLGGCISDNIQTSESVVGNSMTSEIVSSISDSSESLESKSDSTNTFSTVINLGVGFVSILAFILSVFTVCMGIINRKEDKVDNTFFNLIDLHGSIKDKLDGEVINSIYDEIKAETKLRQKSFRKREKIERQNEYLMINHEKMKGIIQELISTNEDNLSKIDNTTLEQIGELLKKETIREQLKNIERKLSESLNNENISEIRHLITTLSENDVCKMYNTNVFEEYLNIDSDPHVFNYSEKIDICNVIYEEHYDEVGHYFRIFHRVIKYVNRNVKNMETKRNYIGILRALLSETEMLVIFYNSFYSYKGMGLGKQLLTTNFFDDQEDDEQKDLSPKNEHKELQHFSRKNLIFGEADISKMRECKLKKYKRKKRGE